MCVFLHGICIIFHVRVKLLFCNTSGTGHSPCHVGLSGLTFPTKYGFQAWLAQGLPLAEGLSSESDASSGYGLTFFWGSYPDRHGSTNSKSSLKTSYCCIGGRMRSPIFLRTIAVPVYLSVKGQLGRPHSCTSTRSLPVVAFNVAIKGTNFLSLLRFFRLFTEYIHLGEEVYVVLRLRECFYFHRWDSHTSCGGRLICCVFSHEFPSRLC